LHVRLSRPGWTWPSKVFVSAAILALAGCGSSKNAASAKVSSSETAKAAAGSGGVLEVTVEPVEIREVASSVQATGSFAAKESSDVAPQTGGRVTETGVDVGAFVNAGQIIARLDDRDAQLRLEQSLAAEQQADAAVRQAESKIGLDSKNQFNPNNVPEVLSAKAAMESAAALAKQAEADAQRYGNLVKTGDVSLSAYEKARTQADTAQAQANAAKQQYEATLNAARQNYQGVMTAEASLAGARSQVALAQKAVEDTLVRAPFAGYVSARPVAVGQYVANTAKIATVLRITPIKLELQVPESNAADVKLAEDVEAEVPGYPGRVFKGRVTAVNPAVDPNSRTFTVIAEFPNSDVALKPGMFAAARILMPGRKPGVFVPRQAVLTDASTNSSQVFFIRDGKARVAVVQLGVNPEGERIQILSGLPENAVVAIDHLQDLYDGESVKTVLKGS
jgi:RND family efflux transporter MFP subunit